MNTEARFEDRVIAYAKQHPDVTSVKDILVGIGAREAADDELSNELAQHWLALELPGRFGGDPWASTRPLGIYEACDVLYRARHQLPPDVLRTIQSVWHCASAARYGEPYEAWDIGGDAEFYATHSAAECEADDKPGDGFSGQPEETTRDWYIREVAFAVDADEMTAELEAELDAITAELGITEQSYARAAQLIACRRNTCGGPGAGHDHIA